MSLNKFKNTIKESINRLKKQKLNEQLDPNDPCSFIVITDDGYNMTLGPDKVQAIENFCQAGVMVQPTSPYVDITQPPFWTGNPPQQQISYFELANQNQSSDYFVNVAGSYWLGGPEWADRCSCTSSPYGPFDGGNGATPYDPNLGAGGNPACEQAMFLDVADYYCLDWMQGEFGDLQNTSYGELFDQCCPDYLNIEVDRHTCSAGGLCTPNPNGEFWNLEQCEQSGCAPTPEDTTCVDFEASSGADQSAICNACSQGNIPSELAQLCPCCPSPQDVSPPGGYAGMPGGKDPGKFPVKNPVKNINPQTMKKTIREAINKLKRKQLNEQTSAQLAIPETGTCPPASVTINSPEELQEILGYNIYTFEGDIPIEMYQNATPQQIQTGGAGMNASVLNSIIPSGTTIKVHSSVYPLIMQGGTFNYPNDPGPNSPFNVNPNSTSPFWPSPAGGIATDPTWYGMSDENFQPEYVYLNTETTGPMVTGIYNMCGFTIDDWECLKNSANCPGPSGGVTPTPPDPFGTAPISGPSNVVMSPGGSATGPTLPPQAGAGATGMAAKPAVKPRMPRRRVNEQVERMKLLAGIKKKK